MKKHNCLSEQELILHYYRDPSSQDKSAGHLVECPLCEQRLIALTKDLARVPNLDHQPDAAAATRITARVNEQLNRRRRIWRPVLGVSTAAAVTLLVLISNWSRQDQWSQAVQPGKPALATLNLSEDMPDVDFFEDLELLKELELLRQIEGV